MAITVTSYRNPPIFHIQSHSCSDNFNGSLRSNKNGIKEDAGQKIRGSRTNESPFRIVQFDERKKELQEILFEEGRIGIKFDGERVMLLG